MDFFKKIFSSSKNKENEQRPSEELVQEPDPKLNELRELANKYGFAGNKEVLGLEGLGIPYQGLHNVDDLSGFWSQDIMAYMITWPGAQGTPGEILIVTHQKLFYATNYCWGNLTYDDFRTILPHLPEKFDDLQPWESVEKNVDGWYWYGIHSGCWLRVHESIWRKFFLSAEYFKDTCWIKNSWSIFVLEAIAHRSRELEKLTSCLTPHEHVYEYTLDDARKIEETGVIAWRESGQGWCGLFCKDGRSYFRCTEANNIINLPINRREEIRCNTLPGWQCCYCGLGHRVIIRDEYYPRFQEMTYGMGKNGLLWNIAFDALHFLLIKDQNVA